MLEHEIGVGNYEVWSGGHGFWLTLCFNLYQSVVGCCQQDVVLKVLFDIVVVESGLKLLPDVVVGIEDGIVLG